MTAGCARCGSCCDPVSFDPESLGRVARWSTAALEGVPDPSTDEGWAYWLEHGHADRERTARAFDPAGDYRANADFIAAHWHPAGERNVACDAYDPETRLCTARESRPPVCRDYPWYGREPDSGKGMPLQCSYLADLPAEKRPEGARPLIPLIPV